MSAFSVYLSAEEVLRLHRRLIARFGDSDCLTDRGALDAALARARSSSYTTLAQQGAALLSSLARQHAFDEGNTRTAFATFAVFLRLNGYRLQVPADAAHHFMREYVIGRKASVEQIPHRLAREEAIRRLPRSVRGSFEKPGKNLRSQVTEDAVQVGM